MGKLKDKESGENRLEVVDDLDSEDPRFVWKLEKDGLSYNIKNVAGFTSSKTIMSSNSKGEYVDLHSEVTRTDRQKWRLYYLGRDEYNIENIGLKENCVGSKCGKPTYLSSNTAGRVDLWYKDEGTDRQRWTLTQIEQYKPPKADIPVPPPVDPKDGPNEPEYPQFPEFAEYPKPDSPRFPGDGGDFVLVFDLSETWIGIFFMVSLAVCAVSCVVWCVMRPRNVGKAYGAVKVYDSDVEVQAINQ